jgi:DNA-binding XRE family transcriptional regulator
MRTKQHSNGVAAKHVTIKGKRMVMLEENEFERLLVEADLWEPLMPPLDADGTYPAEVVRISLAIDIIRDRRRLGLTQAELARRAGIRLATLQRAEQGRDDPSIRTIEKIDRALKAAEGKAVKA